MNPFCKRNELRDELAPASAGHDAAGLHGLDAREEDVAAQGQEDRVSILLRLLRDAPFFHAQPLLAQLHDLFGHRVAEEDDVEYEVRQALRSARVVLRVMSEEDPARDARRTDLRS